MELTGRLSYDYYHYYGHYPLSYPADPTDPITYPADPNVMYQDYALGNWWGTEWQLTKRLFDRHSLTVGAEYRDNFQQDQGNKDDYVIPAKYDVHKESHNFAFYCQAEVLVLTNLILDAGVRYDNYSTFGDTVNPRLALIYSPFQITNIKLLYGTAFRAPNAYELYYAGFYNEANLDLKTETISTYEVVLEQGLTKNLSFIASGFYYKIQDLIRQETDPLTGLLVYRNLDEARAHGAEVELDARFGGGLRGRASYTYQRTEDANGDVLSNSPEHLAKLNLIVPLWKDKLFSGVELQYNSEVKSITGHTVDDYWVVNFTLFSRDIIKNLELSASIYNLFDQKYYNPGAGEHLQDQIQQDGRTFRVKLTYRF